MPSCKKYHYLIFLVTIAACAIAILKVFALHFQTHSNISSSYEVFDPFEPRTGPEASFPTESATFEKIFNYFFWTNSSSCKLAVDFGFSLGPNDKMRMAPDGFKAVCMDPGIGPTYKSCLVYSFGIRDEWSFDERMQDYGCDVYAFDPSMSKDDHQHSKTIWFFKLGLGDEDTDKHSKTSWKMRTLSSIYENLKKKHGDKIIDVLKIDIEFSEWETLPQIYQSGILKRVKQIAMDVHMDSRGSLEKYKQYYETIRSLERDHGFYRFSSRPSPWGNVFMQAWGRRANFAFEMAWYNSRFINTSFNDPYVFW